MRVHAIIKGRVQGVFFRAGCNSKAVELGLEGWVKNRDDGSVETIAEGPEEAVKQFVDWLNNGPAAAAVSNVDIVFSESTGEFPDFKIL